LNPKEYKKFRKATYKGFNRKKNYKKISIPPAKASKLI